MRSQKPQGTTSRSFSTDYGECKNLKNANNVPSRVKVRKTKVRQTGMMFRDDDESLEFDHTSKDFYMVRFFGFGALARRLS